MNKDLYEALGDIEKLRAALQLCVDNYEGIFRDDDIPSTVILERARTALQETKR